ncbi:MAG: hypothetical protein ACKVXR_13225 [Planctomycetota bacterium]
MRTEARAVDFPNPIKLIVTHRAALRHKHGPKVRRVYRALQDLKRADRRRGLIDHVVLLDGSPVLRRLGIRAVRDPTDERAVKEAIEALCRKLKPHFVVLLGGPDVIPHQSLSNPLAQSGHDPVIPSDLPYACEGPHSDNPNAFTHPTRLVGRLAGLTGVVDPASLVSALRYAARWRPRSRRDYERPFMVSALEMEKSTRATLKSVFGHDRGLHVVPPRTGPVKSQWKWPEGQMQRRAHYLNCHGIKGEDELTGTAVGRTRMEPLAHHSPYAGPRIREGTVAVVEACYGAELYDPRNAETSEGDFAGSDQPMAIAYLRHGAYAYFGSTTTSWGADIGAAHADIICQRFMAHIIAGRSSGRAALEARIDYLKLNPEDRPFDPQQLLTVSQFVLLGDPSIHPVVPPGLECRERGPVPHAVRATFAQQAHQPPSVRSPGRQRQVVREVANPRVEGSIHRHLHTLAQRRGGKPASLKTYSLEPRPAPPGSRRTSGGSRSMHVLHAVRPPNARGQTRRIMVVAESDGRKVLSSQVLHSK